MTLWRERLRVPLMLSPALAVILILFMGGLVMGVMQSLGYMPIIGRYDLTLDAYRNIFTREDFYRSLILTVWIGFASTVLSTILAIGCALVLRQAFRGKRGVTFIFQFNIPIPHIVGAIGILFCSRKAGSWRVWPTRSISSMSRVIFQLWSTIVTPLASFLNTCGKRPASRV